jgi:hypothetical protein
VFRRETTGHKLGTVHMPKWFNLQPLRHQSRFSVPQPMVPETGLILNSEGNTGLLSKTNEVSSIYQMTGDSGKTIPVNVQTRAAPFSVLASKRSKVEVQADHVPQCLFGRSKKKKRPTTTPAACGYQISTGCF